MRACKNNKMLIFLNTQTTGVEKEDKVCSIGLIAIDDDKVTLKYDLVNEGKKISSKASSVNNITNEMLKNKPKVKDSEVYNFLLENNLQTTTLVAHNANLELEKLSAFGFNFKGEIIDTLRVTKHLIQECEEFSLQFLRYELKLYKDEQKMASAYKMPDKLSAYNASSNALFIKLLYDYLLQMVTKEKMTNLSFENVLMQKFDFGKYKGKYIEEISMMDKGYLEWMLTNILDLDEDLRYSIDYYLK